MQKTSNRRRLTGELFTHDRKTGKETDAHLHDEMLSGISPEGKASILAGTRAYAKSHYGASDDLLDQLYGGIDQQKLATGGRVGVGKIDRDAFLYMNPKPPMDTFAQCGTCLMFTGTGCTILGKTKITKDMTCGLYVRGKPQYNLKGKEQDLVTPKEAGLVNFQVRCENCRYGGDNCQLFEKLNNAMPETFDLDTKIDPKGCCNAFTRKGG